MNRLRLTLRFMFIACFAGFTVLWYGLRRLGAGRIDRGQRDGLRGQMLAEFLERLGATFIKFGQILSTRPDLLSPDYTEQLAKLQDGVAPAPYKEILQVLKEDLGERQAQLVEIESEPVAAASVAQVHRGRLEGGESVAIKVQRLSAARDIDRDLAIMAIGARLLDKIPTMHLLSLPGSVERFAESLRGQLDFEEEANNNRRFAENFAEDEGIAVPKLYEELCTRRVIVMEFVEGVKATEPEKVGGNRKSLALDGADCILKMVFVHGFVHADMHPGNMILTSDSRVVLIDLGMVVEIPGELLRPYVETFVALSQQDGAAAARLFYSHAPTVGKDIDYARFEHDVVSHLSTLYGKALADVEVSAAISGMMNVLRRHRVQIDPTFTVVNLAMLVAEGLGKQLDPDIDLLQVAMPHLSQAMLMAPPGRPPHRDPPAGAGTSGATAAA